jgi:hypothetical protein
VFLVVKLDVDVDVDVYVPLLRSIPSNKITSIVLSANATNKLMWIKFLHKKK